ncbi:MAG: hypothetical protein WCD76_19155, partial [Pyrinomonadaceae bacterium]
MRPSRHHLKRLLLLTFVVSLVVGSTSMLILSSRAPSRPAAVPSSAATLSQARETYGRIPLSFEANRGQTDEEVNFIARGGGYALFLKPTEAVFALRSSDRGLSKEEQAQRSLNAEAPLSTAEPQVASRNPQSKVLRMKLVGANPVAAFEGADELAGKANYFEGDDPARWRTDVPTFGRVRYGGVYPGIDVVYYGNQRQLEYDFNVAPGADARAVSLEFEGADKLEVDDDGDLLLTLKGEIIRQPRPVIYQEVAGARRTVEGGYVIGEDGRVGFRVGDYDARLPLVIDPTLVYSTYLGG